MIFFLDIPAVNTNALPHHIWNSIRKEDIHFTNCMDDIQYTLTGNMEEKWLLLPLKDRIKR